MTIECLGKICEGGTTTSARPNPLNHMKEKAKTELLENFIKGKGETPHADWFKKNTKVIIKEDYVLDYDK